MGLYFVYELPLLIAALTSLCLVIIVVRRRHALGAPALLVMLAAAGVWAGAYALELRAPTLEGKLLAAKLQYVGIAPLVAAWFLFTVQFTRPDQWIGRTKSGVLLLCIVPVLALHLAWTNERHGLIWSSTHLATSTPIPALVVTHGPGFWLLIGCDYLLLAVGTLWLLGTAAHAAGLLRRQALVLLIGILPVWIANALYVARLGPVPWLDLTPFALAITCIVYAWSLLHLHLLKVIPVARSAIFGFIEDPIIVVDLHDRIVDVNDAARQLAPQQLVPPTLPLAGRPLGVLLGDQAARLHAAGPLDGETPGDIRLARAGVERVYELRASSLHDADRSPLGRVYVLRDITKRSQAEAALQQLTHSLEASVAARTRELQDSTDRLHALGRHLESVREEEQTRIAREVHDELGQLLTVLKMDVRWLQRHLPGDGETVSRKLDAMNDQLSAAIKTVHRIAAELRPPLLDNLGLIAAIDWLADSCTERTGVVCSFVYSGGEAESLDKALDKDLATTLFRICQEALTNVARHAQAATVQVCLVVTEFDIKLDIVDDGLGIAPAQAADPRSFGLIGMRERLLPWNGRMTITGAPQQGTTLSIAIPLQQPLRKSA